MISNPACSARSSSRPFDIPAQPMSGAVRTSKAVRMPRRPAGTLSSSKRSRGIRPPGERNHPARRLDRKARIYLSHDLLGGVAVAGIVDHGLCRHARPAHDKGARHHIGLALDVGAATPVDHGNAVTTNRTCLRAATSAVPGARPKDAGGAEHASKRASDPHPMLAVTPALPRVRSFGWPPRFRTSLQVALLRPEMSSLSG